MTPPPDLRRRDLAAPGSSTYSSNTLHVGDGTWDSTRDSFLLPNLMGVNFATMRYNGMGNRFLAMTSYHRMILAHGVLGAIVFLGLVPAAILINRFYSRNPYWALRIHIWLQILTFLLTTVVFILGFFAVGPERSLTNPHHGIGLAIYVLVIIQLLGGWLMHRKERERRRYHISLKVMLHQWMGRAVALLGIAQVPLGLTLYGSPESLFILFAIWGFGMLLLYFFLSYTHQRDINDYDSRGSYLTEQEAVEEGGRRHSGLARWATAGAAGAGLAALWRRRSQRSRRPNTATDLGPESEGSYLGEKYSDTSRPGIGHRLLQVGAIGAGLAAVRSLFKRRQRDDASVSSVSYRPPLGGNQSVADGSYSIVDEARPITPGTPGRQGQHPLSQPPITPSRRPSASSLSYSSYLSGTPSRHDRHTFRDTLATLGAVAALRQLFRRRRQNREDRRAEEMREHEIEQERIQRANSQGRFTGDGSIPRRHRRHGSQTASSYSSFDDQPGGRSGILPTAGAGAAAAAALDERNRIRPAGQDPQVSGSAGIPITDVPPIQSQAPIPPPHAESSVSDAYSSPSRPSTRRHGDEAAAGLAGAALGAAAAEGSRRRHSGRYATDGQSPSASVKVKMHQDGQHVTLRRLTEEEREQERRARRETRRRRHGSVSSTSGTEGTSGGRRWRRTEDRERRQAAEMQAQQAGAVPPETIAGPSTVIPQGYTLPPPPPGPPPGSAGHPMIPEGTHIPPPPPIPESQAAYPYGASSVTSPGTETSGTYSSEFAANRRRRRAERAQAKLARQGRSNVEFT